MKNMKVLLATLLDEHLHLLVCSVWVSLTPRDRGGDDLLTRSDRSYVDPAELADPATPGVASRRA